MEWIDVLGRIQDGEGEHTEFKQWPAFPRKVGAAVCAFANTEGGLVILGVDDSGAIVGVSEDAESAQERLSSWLQSGLSSPVQARLGRQQDPGGWVHWIEVAKMRGPSPMRYDGRVYVRRGRASVEPGDSELQDLYNTFGLVLTEERVIPGAGIADLDVGCFRTFLERQGIDLNSEPQTALEIDARNRGLLEEDIDGALRCTLYGLLCFGTSPQLHAPTRSFWIELVAYAGGDRVAPVLLVGEAKGRLDEQVERSVAWLKGLGRLERYTGLTREDGWFVPLDALREVLVNAVAHRDYSILGSRVLLEVYDDRVVVTSPGTLPNHLRPESVLAGAHPRSRNELMAQYLLVRGLMESRGRGFLKIRAAMAAFNGSEPRLEANRDDRFVRVTLLRAQR